MTAERNRRALVLQAEGERQAAITRAQGEKQAAITSAEGSKTSAILRAEGSARTRLLAADAETKAITRISEGMAQSHLRETDEESRAITPAARTAKDVGAPANYLITSRYIEGLRDMARSENVKVIFMPAQTSRVLGSAGVINEILSRLGEKS